MKQILIAMLLVFTYTAENGTLCFTDNIATIPAKYVNHVTAREVGPLSGYGKYSTVSKPRPTVVPVNISNSYDEIMSLN